MVRAVDLRCLQLYSALTATARTDLTKEDFPRKGGMQEHYDGYVTIQAVRLSRAFSLRRTEHLIEQFRNI